MDQIAGDLRTQVKLLAAIANEATAKDEMKEKSTPQ